MGIKQKIRSFKKGIKNLIVWFPIIWKDRQFDQSWFYTIVIKKLELMEKAFKDDTLIENSDLFASQISKSLEAMKLLQNETYQVAIADELYSKWGEPKIFSKPLQSCPGYSAVKIKHENINTKEDERNFKEEHQRALELMMEVEQKLLKDAFDTIRDNIQDWWI